jgi:uncharacterized membrane protein YfcA
MLKIQYGFAGFMIGAFTGILIGAIEMRLINDSKYALLFFVIALTIIICGITGMRIGIRMAARKMKK